jgi:hypothetical protein
MGWSAAGLPVPGRNSGETQTVHIRTGSFTSYWRTTGLIN